MTDSTKIQELEQLISILTKEKEEALEQLDQIERQSISKETFYQYLIDHSKERMLIVQGEHIKYLNPAVLQLLGCTKEELSQVNFSDLIIPEQRGQAIHLFSDVMSGLLDQERITLNICSPTDQEFKADLVVEKLKNEHIRNLLLIRFESPQEESKQQDIEKEGAQTIFERLSKEGMLILSQPDQDPRRFFSWIVEESNKAAHHIFNKAENELKGTALREAFVPEFEYEFNTIPGPGFQDTVNLRIENLHVYLEFSVTFIDNKRLSCRVIEVTQDVGVKKELEKSIRQNEVITEILRIINDEGSFHEKLSQMLNRIAFNIRANRILVLEHDKEEHVGRLISQFADKGLNAFNDTFELSFKKVPSYVAMLQDRQMVLGFSIQHLPQDMLAFFMGIQFNSVYIFPVYVENSIKGSIIFEAKENEKWDNTEITYLKVVSYMITTLYNREWSEQKLVVAKNKAEEADRLKSSFLANMSHDIRIPMTAIIGFSDLLADPDLTLGEREEFVEMVNKSGQDLLTLVDNIIDVSKIETGQLRILNEKVPLENLLKECFAFHLRNDKLKNQDDLELVLDFQDKFIDIPFETDPFRFKQVLDNLIDNAIKFTEKGMIRFGVHNMWDETIEFYVQDTGIGISEETQGIIFERFSKVDRSYTKEYNGTGLGLALSKSIVELMDGDIRVVSYEGRGSTFYFTHPLPSGAKIKVEKNKQGQSLPEYDWSDKSILIAEDVEQNYKYIEFMLRATKVKLHWVKNGADAVAYFEEKKVADVVLMDIRMPVMNGIDATKEILKKISVPIVAQTAYTFGDEQHLALQAGCHSFLSKPIHARSLLPLLQDIFTQTE